MTHTTKPVEPVAWVIPGDDNANCYGFIDAMAWQEGEFTRPLVPATALDAKDAEIERLTVKAEKAEAETFALVAAACEQLRELAAICAWQGIADGIPAKEIETGIREIPIPVSTAALEAYGAAKVREGWEAGMKESAAKGYTAVIKGAAAEGFKNLSKCVRAPKQISQQGFGKDATLEDVVRWHERHIEQLEAAIKEKQP